MTLDLDQQIDQKADTGRVPPRLMEARFSRTVLSFTDLADVSIASYDTAYEYQGCPWPRRDNADLPQVGDRCLVAFTDNEDRPWVVGWWSDAQQPLTRYTDRNIP